MYVFISYDTYSWIFYAIFNFVPRDRIVIEKDAIRNRMCMRSLANPVIKEEGGGGCRGEEAS
jgi:hypothetical protein